MDPDTLRALLMLGILIATLVAAVAVGVLAYRWTDEAEERFWQTWLDSNEPFADDDLVRFNRKFPRRCAICSMIRYAYNLGLDHRSLKRRHACVEKYRYDARR